MGETNLDLAQISIWIQHCDSRKIESETGYVRAFLGGHRL